MSDRLIQELVLPGPMPGLNDLIGHGKHGYMLSARIKKKWHQTIALCAASQRFQPVECGVFMYKITEPSRRRDPSNFCFAAVKLIEDGLQQAGLLKGDGWANVEMISFHWDMGDHPEVRILVNGKLWKEAEHERREKGNKRFRRATQSDQRVQALARQTRERRAKGSRAIIPAGDSE